MLKNVILKRKMKFMDEEVKRRDMCSEMLEYYLVENSTNYGVKIIKKHGNSNSLYEESFYADNIGDYEKANNVIDIFARNRVTPMGADEVLEDLSKSF